MVSRWGIGLVVFLACCFFVTSAWAVPLGMDQVYIRNESAQVWRENLVNVPISFSPGTSVSQLSTIQLIPASGGTGIPTQVTATSYYPNGTVKTALARTLPTLAPGQEKIYQLGSGISPAFVVTPEVQDFMTNGSILASSSDLLGGKYQTSFRLGTARLIENGPVARVYKVIEKLRPVSNCNALTSDPQGCLPYLFTGVFYVTVTSGKSDIHVESMIVNWGDLSQDTGFPNYTDGQTGFTFFDEMHLEFRTGSSPLSVYVMDSAMHAPSFLQPISPTQINYVILPSNGQQVLSQAPYGDGPNTSNFMAAGQGLATKFTLYLRTPVPNYDIYEENKIYSGQSLARWNSITGYFFPDVVNPEAIDPGYDFRPDAVASFNTYRSLAANPANGHRFGLYALTFKDLQTAGFAYYYRQEPIPIVKYLLSCQSVRGCEKDFLQTLRFSMYSSAQTVDHAIGLNPLHHPQANPDAYASPNFEVNGQNGLQAAGVYGATDLLGMEHRNTQRPGEPYRKDAQGISYTNYMPPYTTAHSHGWTARDGAHMSLGSEFYTWMLTGSHLSRDLGLHQANNVLTMFQFYKNNYSSLQFAHTTRTRGRVLKAAQLAFASTGDPDYIPLLKNVIDVIDYRRDTHTSGQNGTNPVTGEPFPVKNFGGKPTCNPGEPFYIAGACKIQLFEETQVLHGLAAVYLDGLLDAPYQAKVQDMLANEFEFLYTWGYKKYNAVANGKPGGNNTIIREGMGGHAVFNEIIGGMASNSMTNPSLFRAYTKFNYEQDPQIYQGWCHALKAAERMGGSSVFPDFLKYKREFLDLFTRAYVTPSFLNYGYTPGIMLNDPVGPYGSEDGVKDEEMCGLHFAMGVPNAVEANACHDNDNDGFTNCVGDGADNNPNVRPNKVEVCTNGVDDNLNGLLDCNDRACAWSYTGGQYILNPACLNVSNGFCGNGLVNAPNHFGQMEQCDFSSLSGAGVNACVNYTCIAPFVGNAVSCTCATPSIPSPGGGGVVQPPSDVVPSYNLPLVLGVATLIVIGSLMLLHFFHLKRKHK